MSHPLRESIDRAEREASERARDLAKPRKAMRSLGLFIMAATGGLMWLGGYAEGRSVAPCPPVAVARVSGP